VRHPGVAGLSVLGRVTALLRERTIPFAVIGAAAMAAHGVTRGTRDLDLLTVVPQCLDPAMWGELRTAGILPEPRLGDADDPLAGVVRFTAPGEAPLDLVVGKSAWQAALITRARATQIQDAVVPVAGPADLILLKLYAGGPQDAWDVEQLLAGPDRATLVALVDSEIAALPPESQRLWARIRGEPQ
jgi:hypothetical protein